ncbi:MAG: hypothetical protein JSR19_03100 [Proteobacteria bacterium]|nr:hypothetical protein [Pseudomonadota bacterium]HQR03811.1 Ca2+-dependent phosphoinositide-specific phospholipase C [Rhodocyclaceae bacterium]
MYLPTHMLPRLFSRLPARFSSCLLPLLLLCIGANPACAADPYPKDTVLHLNQMQVLGTHNSYHPEPPTGPALEVLRGSYPELAEIVNYRHPTLTQQLDLGVRQFELDVWSDPQGGNYAYRPLYAKVGANPDTGSAALRAPGLKVLHIAQVDAQSSCLTLEECLGQLKRWSDAHPRHVPLMVMIEIKDLDFFATRYLPMKPWQAADYDALDAEIRSVLPPDRLITPDDVQGQYPTLREAVLAGAWPTLAQSRGKFLFTGCNCIAGDRQHRDYLRADGSLRGRVLFPNTSPDRADAAFVLMDDPVRHEADIRRLVSQGFIVRTRSDANTVEARHNDYRRAEKAFASGAQFVSTDYEVPDTTINPTFRIAVPGGTPARCNPVNAPAGCQATDIERPDALK